MKVLLDSSVLVGALLAHHPWHERALPWLRRGRNREFQWYLASHSLLETYAILTRYPVRPRVSPDAALLLIEDLLPFADILSLSPAEHLEVLASVSSLGLSGGVVYDAHILRVARGAEVDRLVTFNEKDFRRLWPDAGERILSP